MSTLLLEVGTEELPASFLGSAIRQWQETIPAALAALNLPGSQVRIAATPRRLVILIAGLPPQQPNRVDAIKGPPLNLAQEEGAWTAAALGFARKQGVTAADLEIRETEKGSFLFAIKRVEGKPTPELLSRAIPLWITELKGERLMRWGSGELKFPRPIRWLVCLWDEQILPIHLEGVTADRLTWVHRILHPEPITITAATTYFEQITAGFVQPDPHYRRQLIAQEVQHLATQSGGVATVTPDLLAEVTHLVEWPTAVLGHFDPEFLALPAPLITMVMTTHQRYFPVYDAAHPEQLLPCFITVSNGDPAKSALIAAGNSRVIRARLADARFFYQEDQKISLSHRVEQLARVTFVEELGSMREKVTRIEALGQHLCQRLQLPPHEYLSIHRTAHLCKADLVTQMVYEFPELQGVMGADYARREQEAHTVVQGIEEHYWPLGAGDPLPRGIEGVVVGIADRLDTLVGLFHLGRIPTGSSDRFALRRAANNIVLVIWEHHLTLSLVDLVEMGLQVYGIPAQQSVAQALLGFFQQRLRSLLQEEYHLDYDLINAVLPEQDAPLMAQAVGDPAGLLVRAQTLQQWRASGALAQIYAPLTRSTRLAAQGSLPLTVLNPQEVLNPLVPQEVAEQALWAACQTLYEQGQRCQGHDYGFLLDAFVALTPVIDTFFAAVLVMDPDPTLRVNRLNLLGIIRNHTRLLGDFAALVMTGDVTTSDPTAE